MRQRYLIRMPNGRCVGEGKTLKAAVKCTLKFFYYTEIVEKGLYGVEIDTSSDKETGRTYTSQELFDIGRKLL